MPRATSILLTTVLILSQLFAVVGVAYGSAWCHHPDGEVVVETATERAECHAAQTEPSGTDSSKSCVDVPVDDGVSSQPSRSDLSRELSALQASLLVSTLPTFGIDYHLIASKSVIRPLSDEDNPSREVVLDSLSTVIILT